MKGTPIYKHSYLMNGRVYVSAMAENEDIAINRLKVLFGEKEDFELIKKEFSHYVGDFFVTKKEKRSETFEEKKSEEKDLMTSVMDAYARDKKYAP